MRFNRLGVSEIMVSEICLGTMTFGEQNTEAEGHQQLDMAVDYGVNFIDTAEMYSIPVKPETFGRTEEIIGSWLRRTRKRAQVVLASKVIGKADWMPHVRNGRACLDRANIEQAIEGSLRRLQTDYLDLYQLHWPDRDTNFFGIRSYIPGDQANATQIEETLCTLNDIVASGKVRQIGISNETPWGMMQYLRISENKNLPRVVSIQNPYNLLNRSFEVGLAEMSHREHVGLLAYSPLGFGVLTGKYLQQQPAQARLTLYKAYQRYSNDNGIAATQCYVDIARKHGLSAAQMSLAFVIQQPFVTANIIGATTLEQLKENLLSSELTLSKEIIQEIEAVQLQYPNPCP